MLTTIQNLEAEQEQLQSEVTLLRERHHTLTEELSQHPINVSLQTLALVQ